MRSMCQCVVYLSLVILGIFSLQTCAFQRLTTPPVSRGLASKFFLIPPPTPPVHSLSAVDNDEYDVPEQFSITPRRIAYGTLWLGLLTYTFTFSPGGSPEAAAKDTELITNILSTPFDGSISPIFGQIPHFDIF